MATSYSDRLRLALQGTGDNPNTWGAITNQAVIELLEDSVAGVEELIVGSTNITLTTANGSVDQARKAVLKLTGVISAEVDLIVPNEQKIYFIDAGFTGPNTLTVKPVSGTGIGFTAGQRGVVYCNGVNVILITKDFDSSTLGDLAFLDTITSTGLLANGIVTTSTMATGAVTASILAPGVLTSLLPVQTSNAGKFLTTNGTSVSWGALPTFTAEYMTLSYGSLNGSSIVVGGTEITDPTNAFNSSTGEYTSAEGGIYLANISFIREAGNAEMGVAINGVKYQSYANNGAWTNIGMGHTLNSVLSLTAGQKITFVRYSGNVSNIMVSIIRVK